MENEVVDRSSGRNSRLCSDAGETLLDSCIRQTVNEDISMPSVTSFIWCSLSFSFSFYFQQWNNLPWCLAVIFFLFYVSFHLNPLLSTQAILRHINFSHFYLIIFSFCLPTHIFTFFPHSLQWFLCPGLLHHLSSFHSLSHYHNHALSDVSLAPHLSLTCGNLCSLHRPTALLDENVGNISLLSMHANRLWVFLAL